MKILLGFEHVQRLVGAHSQLVTELGRRLVQRGHQVSILCDTVTDPELVPEVQFIPRRPFRWGDSHRLTALRKWAQRTRRAVDYDVSVSFHPAISADIVAPAFGWIHNRLRHEDRFLKSTLRARAINFHYNVVERKLVEKAVRRDPGVRFFLAFSTEMADALADIDLELRQRIRMVHGASPIEPPTGPGELEALRAESRKILGFSDDQIVFLWAAKHGLHHGRKLVINAFARMAKEVGPRAQLVLAGEGQWKQHDQTVDAQCDDQVHIMGRTADMEMLLAACDVGLNPSIHSTLGRFVWECLAFGKPVIASNRTGGLDRMRNADQHLAGRVVRAGDVNELYDTMRALCDPGALATTTRVAASIAPTMRFDSFVDRMEKVMSEVAE